MNTGPLACAGQPPSSAVVSADRFCAHFSSEQVEGFTVMREGIPDISIWWVTQRQYQVFSLITLLFVRQWQSAWVQKACMTDRTGHAPPRVRVPKISSQHRVSWVPCASWDTHPRHLWLQAMSAYRTRDVLRGSMMGCWDAPSLRLHWSTLILNKAACK
ncbi:hypothetical protein IQ06DRAFT_92395 [Phaeosphaeriaceae sp. SRC1lsM3a]|nr:hypothetical protein IQ06DRAFT_92395 [Stagonospora sp. SRC1lsM3a]